MVSQTHMVPSGSLLKLQRRISPWKYQRDDTPSRVISTLEALGVLVALKLKYGEDPPSPLSPSVLPQDSSDFFTLLSWRRSSSTTAVVCPWLVLLFWCSSHCFSFVCRQDSAARHLCRYGPEGLFPSRLSSTPTVASPGLVLLVAPRAVFLPVVVYRPQMLGIMAGMDSKDCFAPLGSGMCLVAFTGDPAPRAAFFPPAVRRRCSASLPVWTRWTVMWRDSGGGMCKARFAGILDLALCFFPVVMPKMLRILARTHQTVARVVQVNWIIWETTTWILRPFV